ncbi:hypothetical protein JM16_009613 [Phytophthora kernoviae]|uniref:ABC-2 type transporter domain-containing protein n=1 Tax=Phytophthora kernoviae TaxID=325452 RepID=A0A8T0LII9_9STRA|nr:hypothetical protein JM16_009613 [Phytophthora kernoviae]
MISLCLGVVFGLVLVNGEYTTYQGLNAAVGVIFMTTQYNGIAAYVGTLPFTGHERGPYYRERASQTYNALWYFVGATFAELPYVFFSGFLFTATFYPLIGFTSFSTWVLYWINLSLFILMQTYLGQLFIYALPSVEVAAIVGVMINAIFLLFAGFNPPAGSIPEGYKWLYYITPQRYSLSILTALLFGECDQDPIYDEATQSFVNVGSQLGCQPLENTPMSIGHMTVKNYVENVYGMNGYVLAIAGIVDALIAAYEAQEPVNMTRLKNDVAKQFRIPSMPKLVDIISAVPEDHKEKLLPFLKAKPVRTASGIAVVVSTLL